MIEGRDKEEIKNYADQIVEIINKKLN